MPTRKLKARDVSWAKERVKDLFLACTVNIVLKNGEVCTKYLYEMTDVECVEYFRMVAELFDVSKKKV